MSSVINKIAIIGAGVAGARLAYLLSKKDIKVMMFDHRAPWEKPCGGGLTPKVFKDFPDLKEMDIEGRRHHHLSIISPSGRDSEITIPSPIITVSREKLGRALLDNAINAGAQLINEHVDLIINNNDSIEIVAGNKEYKFDFVVGADGTNGIVRRTFSTKLVREDICLVYGQLLPVEISLPIIIKFYEGFHGYSWIFPRKGATSVGIAMERGGGKRDSIVAELRAFVKAEWRTATKRPVDIGRPWAWQVPAMRPQSFIDPQICGERWALIGDASGSADPLTGEGIYYALKTAHMLAEAILAGRLETYTQAWKNMVEVSIGRVSSMRARFYRPFYLNLTTFLLDYSQSTRKLAREMIVGMEEYHLLKPRVLSELPLYITESAINCLLRKKGERR